MMASDKLAAALTAVDWNSNVAQFLKGGSQVQAVARSNLRLAIWAKQLESVDKGNPALCFIREMQISGQHVAALIGLALYKSAAASMRGVFESALYYTYFRSHPEELATLVRNNSYYVEKRELIDYHKLHTSDFTAAQSKLSLLSKLEKWYSIVSSLIHGQVPGAWVEHKALSAIKHNKDTLDIAVKTFAEGEEIVHLLFLCTVGKQFWDFFSPHSKGQLAHGLSGEVKELLGLDTA